LPVFWNNDFVVSLFVTTDSNAKRTPMAKKTEKKTMKASSRKMLEKAASNKGSLKKTPVKAAPMKAAPMKAAPMKAAPMKAAPVKAAPVKAAPKKVTKGAQSVVRKPKEKAPTNHRDRWPFDTHLHDETNREVAATEAQEVAATEAQEVAATEAQEVAATEAQPIIKTAPLVPPPANPDAGGAIVGGTDPCTCGHAPEEHGHNDEFPGSTACVVCEDGDCVAYESDPGSVD
jgi:hypothetical protein